MRMLYTLLSTPGINPECVNHAGQIPAELAEYNYSVIEMISNYLEHKNTQLETSQTFCGGDLGGSKSTLIKAVTTERSKSFKNSFKAKNVNPSKRATASPHVILVGSHKDKVKERGENVQKTMEQITNVVRGIPVFFQFKAFPLDCRKLPVMCHKASLHY